MHPLAFSSGLVFLVGCAASVAPPLPPDPPDGPVVIEPAAVEDPSHLPLSIQRIVAEQRTEVSAVAALASPVGDARGRERAAREVADVTDELRAIETGLRSGDLESDQLDAVVVRLQRLQTRIALLHDALRVASGPSTAVEKE